MPSDLTGARLVEAGAVAVSGAPFATDRSRKKARAAIRAQVEAAGVTAEDMIDLAECLDGNWSDSAQRVAALLRALAEVLRDE